MCFWHYFFISDRVITVGKYYNLLGEPKIYKKHLSLVWLNTLHVSLTFRLDYTVLLLQHPLLYLPLYLHMFLLLLNNSQKETYINNEIIFSYLYIIATESTIFFPYSPEETRIELVHRELFGIWNLGGQSLFNQKVAGAILWITPDKEWVDLEELYDLYLISQDLAAPLDLVSQRAITTVVHKVTVSLGTGGDFGGYHRTVFPSQVTNTIELPIREEISL